MNQMIPWVQTAPLSVVPYLQSTAHLGSIHVRDDIQSRMGPFNSFPDYQVSYPRKVVQALIEMYVQYNAQFDVLVAANREWETDYQYCVDAAGGPLNRWVQIDMVGLPEQFLKQAASYTVTEIQQVLRNCIFEIENSLAMYQMLERIHDSRFRDTFRASLTELRRQYGKPIALLAVTQEKYDALVAEEFGLNPGDSVTDAQVAELSGFDRLFSPDEFKAHVQENGGACQYLLYVRSSDPTTKLKRPDMIVEHPLLGDPTLRRVIRANSLTYNVDDPAAHRACCINDTKAYMTPMEMGFTITKETDLVTPEFLEHIQNGKPVHQFVGVRLRASFRDFLIASGVNPVCFANGERCVRVKPLQGTYGCYGHYTINLARGGKKRNEWRRQMASRGGYVVQPEFPTALVTDSQSRVTYGYIDRNFFTVLNGEPVFMSGFRTLIAQTAQEAKKGRFHGNKQTVWAAIN